ncbi:phthiocerol/phthiodiolone dimycocerosyl transferase family protein [Nocardia sp. CA-135398]|uniref:phthiocerol/phthiodiolone dimycocerosyl transferase family protein n=1 Tax=Nocardia sp. CA-135398 TaxID=3239977 RepID=UPI003D98B9E9
MTAQRPLSPFELTYFGSETHLGSVPTGGMPLFIGSTVHGLLDVGILRRVLDELAADHPLLRSKPVADADGTLYFHRDDAYRPRLEISDGGEAEYLNLVNAPRDWHDGLFRAHLLRDGDRDRIVLVIHHGIADGRSAFALLAQLWQRYTAHATGTALPQSDSDQDLPASVDTRLAEVVSDAEITGWLDQIRAGAAMMGPESAPRSLPIEGDGTGDDPLGRFALQRIELDTKETRQLVDAARAHGLSVNSLLVGAALVAFRAQLEPATGGLPVFCGHAVDMRSELKPPVSEHTILNCASGVGTAALVAEDAGAIDIAHVVAAGMAAAMAQREAPLFLLASQRVQDEATAAMFAAAPTVAISNIGRLPAHSTPDGIRRIRDDIYAMGPGMPPKLTVFTVGGRLTIQVEYDTALYSRAQMGKVGLALIDALQGIE